MAAQDKMETTLRETTLIFKALAHPCRLRLLITLTREQICDVGTFTQLCGRQQPYVSQQLRVLRHCGLVVGEPHGQHVCYRLASPRVAAILWAAGLLDQFPAGFLGQTGTDRDMGGRLSAVQL